MTEILRRQLPKTPFNNIAISLSGGGYRASAFHLGVLTYLSTVKWLDVSLLERIRILSTVSGGTFTGVKYSTTQSIEKTYADLYKFMTEVDWMEACLDKLTSSAIWKENKPRSLINAASLVYFEKFESNTFSILFDNPTFHLKEIIFNATEFKYGLPFRFQKTQYANYQYAYLGNRQVNFSTEELKELRLADVIAASSCFPLGFEPINFPDDFTYNGSILLANLKQSKGKDKWGNYCQFPIGLMDGGIDDNQGVDSVIWAEERMSKYPDEYKDLISDDVKAIDLFIISDVSSPFMKGFVKSENNKIPLIGNWSFRTLKWMSLFSLLISVLSFSSIYFISSKTGILFSAMAGTLFMIISLITGFFSKGFIGLAKKMGVPQLFIKKLRNFNNLKFNIYANLLINRLNSAKSMISEVFMKQIRRFAFDKVYHDVDWEPRVITNSVYELIKTEVSNRNSNDNRKILNEFILNPSNKIQQVAEKAYSMETTLWFTPDQLKKDFFEHNMPESLIACGQFSICYNLIEYIEKILWNSKYEINFINDMGIKSLHDSLMKDWEEFNSNPFWMVDKFNDLVNIK